MKTQEENDMGGKEPGTNEIFSHVLAEQTNGADDMELNCASSERHLNKNKILILCESGCF